MKVNSINIPLIFATRTINRFVSSPAFKSQQPQTDVFIKSSEPSCEISEVEKRRSALPEYLYHLTNRDCYEKIKESGQIKLSKDIIDGVFMFDMQDFQTNWRNSKNVSNTGTMARSLLEQALKNKKGLVLLKIPTKDLDPMKIAIRPEDEVITFIQSEHFRNLCTAYAEKGGIFNNKWELPKDLVNGHSPVKAKEYIDNGRAIEYVYQGNIDIEDVGVENVLELPEIGRTTLWGYGIQHYNDLFETIKEYA